jgi:plastocyanin
MARAQLAVRRIAIEDNSQYDPRPLPVKDGSMHRPLGEMIQDMRLIYRIVFVVFALGYVSVFPAAAADTVSFQLVLKNHRFEPAELHVPAGKRVELVIENRDPTPEEFESHDLRREKVIAGNSKASVWVGPLPAGEYGFYGEFNQATAKGKLIAK